MNSSSRLRLKSGSGMPKSPGKKPSISSGNVKEEMLMKSHGIEPLELKDLEYADYLCNPCAFIDYTDDPPPGIRQ